MEAQLAAVGGDLEGTRQEMMARLEAAAAEVAAWRGSAEASCQAAEQARAELAAYAAEVEGAGAKMRQLAELLAAANGSAAAATGSSPGGGSPAAGPPPQALQFHRTSPGASSGSPPSKRSPGGKRGEQLPRLKTRAVYGATLRQPGEGDSPGIPASFPPLAGSPSGGRGVQRERSTGAGGVAWAVGTGDRHSESVRDAVSAASCPRLSHAPQLRPSSLACLLTPASATTSSAAGSRGTYGALGCLMAAAGLMMGMPCFAALLWVTRIGEPSKNSKRRRCRRGQVSRYRKKKRANYSTASGGRMKRKPGLAVCGNREAEIDEHA